jgi:hypothetical protein
MENDIIINGKTVDESSVEVEGVDMRDFPDFCDAFASSAQFEDGTDLSDDELATLTSEHGGLINDLAHDSLF